MRNKLIDEYFGVDVSTVGETILDHSVGRFIGTFRTASGSRLSGSRLSGSDVVDAAHRSVVGWRLMAADIARIEGILRGLVGVKDVRRLDGEARAKLLRVESEYEGCSVIPIRNIGVQSAAGRAETLVVLKDASFRPPPTPTVYMVEELDGAAPAMRLPDEAAHEPHEPHELRIEGRRYRVIGEEIIGDRDVSAEQAIFLAETFAMFPERRTGRGVPCLFILPPLVFPELDERRYELGIADVVSNSPSIAADGYLREKYDFPRRNHHATLLVGFNRAH
jgi:hypothetical protein